MGRGIAMPGTSTRDGLHSALRVNGAHEAEALDAVIAGLEQRGYAIVPLSQLLS